jgi:hypothetical protein
MSTSVIPDVRDSHRAAARLLPGRTSPERGKAVSEFCLRVMMIPSRIQRRHPQAHYPVKGMHGSMSKRAAIRQQRRGEGRNLLGMRRLFCLCLAGFLLAASALIASAREAVRVTSASLRSAPGSVSIAIGLSEPPEFTHGRLPVPPDGSSAPQAGFAGPRCAAVLGRRRHSRAERPALTARGTCKDHCKPER